MAHPKRRQSHTRTAKRRTHDKAVAPTLAICPNCGAWHIYHMTTQIPDAFYVAINRKRGVKVPDMLNIKLVYQSDSILGIGVIQEEIEGIKINIYNRERCVCDAIKYRNKIGIDVMAEILDAYLKFEHRNLSLLSEYAKKLRVFNTLSTYLNVKL